jgi:hypothetical protein
MQRYNATVGQRIRLRGDWTETPVTEVDYDPSLAPPALAMEAAAPYETHTPRPGWRPAPDNYGETHTILGSEEMSDIWVSRARLCALPQAAPQAPRWLAAGRDFVIHQVERQGTSAYRIVLRITHRQWRHGLYWLQLTDRLDRSFACLLPGDRRADPRYLLELVLGEADAPGDPRPLVQMEAGLASANAGLLQDAAYLWQIYINAGAGAALAAAEMQRLEAMLAARVDSPLAALVAGLILVRTRRWAQLHQGLRDLAQRFDFLPDGAVLRLEQLLAQSTADLLRADAEKSLAQAFGLRQPRPILDYLLALNRRGLPATSEGFSYAARQTAIFLQHGEGLAPAQRAALEELQARLQRALPFLRSGGLFSVFAGPAAEIHPGLVHG